METFSELLLALNNNPHTASMVYMTADLEVSGSISQ